MDHCVKNITNLEEQVALCNLTLKATMGGLKKRFIHPMVILHQSIMQKDMSGDSLIDCFGKVESRVKRLSTDAGVFGSFNLGEAHSGPSTSKNTMVQIDNLEAQNTSLQNKLNELKKLVSSLVVQSTSPGDDDTKKGAILARISALENGSGPGITIIGYAFGGPNDCEYFLLAKVP